MKKTLIVLFSMLTIIMTSAPAFADSVHGPYWMDGQAPNRTVEWLDKERTYRDHYEEILLDDWYSKWNSYYDYIYNHNDEYTYEYSYVYDETTGLYHLLIRTIKNGVEESLKEFQLDNEDMNVFIRLVQLAPNQEYKLENYDDPLYLQRYKRIIDSIFINYHIVDESTYSMQIYIE